MNGRFQTRVAWIVGMVLIPTMGQSCIDTGIGGTSPRITLSPDSQSISDVDYAILAADFADGPEVDADHEPARLVWTILGNGSGTLTTATTGDVAMQEGKGLDVTPGDSPFDRVAIYHPDLGASGDVIVKVELRQKTYVTMREPDPRDPGGPLIERRESDDRSLAEATSTISINNELLMRLTPQHTTLPADGTVEIEVVFQAPGGGIAPDPEITRDRIQYEWQMSGLAGAGTLEGADESADKVTFRAGNERATFTISCKATEVFSDGSERINGPVHATVEVDPELNTAHTFGYYIPKDESDDPDFYYVVAWVYVPKFQGAVSYLVEGENMHDDAFYGDSASWSYTGANGQFASLEDVGGAYRFGLSSAGGAQGGGASAGAYAWMDSRFAGMTVRVTVVYQD